jgi:hypothetical protein
MQRTSDRDTGMSCFYPHFYPQGEIARYGSENILDEEKCSVKESGMFVYRNIFAEQVAAYHRWDQETYEHNPETDLDAGSVSA